jgi:NAD(P)-dependent dehydrogenase (short-subunit alcohol dehydrogenase family)
MNLKGQTALVTGGAVRIGAAICRALAEQGAHVVVHYHRSEAAARELCQELAGFGVRAFRVQAELGSGAACARLVADAVRQAGQLDLLVNNAAVFHKDHLRAVTEEKLLAEFWPNLFAPMLLLRAFAEQCARGRIVNLLDRRIAGDDVACAPYLLSKKALAELTRLAALEFAPAIAVNGVAPGAVLPPPGRGKDYLRDQAGPVPLQRQVTPEEVAEVVVFLLQSDAITGQIVFVDGGQHLLGNLKLET